MRISVYITSYNQKEFLKEAIESVLAQTLKPFEIIIIDDASTDGSLELINSYTDNYPGWVKSIVNTSNRGIAFCRSYAIKAACGDYITWVDGDDFFMPDKLEKESKLLENGKYQIAFSNYYLAYNNLSKLIRIWADDVNSFPKSGNMFKEVLSRSFPRGKLYRSELIESELLKNTNLYDENLEIYEDYDIRIRLSYSSKINFTIEPLSIYRLHEHGLSRAPNELHYESIKYIVSKYQKEIESLGEPDASFVKKRIKGILESKNPKRKNIEYQKYNSTKSKVKRTLINLINKM